MKIIIGLVFSIAFVFLFEKWLKKYSVYFYVGIFGGLSIVSLIPEKNLPVWLNQLFQDYILKGILPTAFFVLVMYAILLPRKSRLFRMLMSLRGELAIIASLMIAVHCVKYGLNYVMLLFTQPSDMRIHELIGTICALFLCTLMVPLFITSFKRIRRKMDGKKWKQLQRFSYGFYGLLYLHICMIYVPRISVGELNVSIDFSIYTIIFMLYAVLRTRKALEKKKKVLLQTMATVVGTIGIIATTGYAFLPVYAQAREQGGQGNSLARKDGVYVGEGFGFKGNTKVSVTMKNGRIDQIEIVGFEDDPAYFNRAKDIVVESILESQSTQVDAVSGATYSSKGIMKAVEKALGEKMETAK